MTFGVERMASSLLSPPPPPKEKCGSCFLLKPKRTFVSLYFERKKYVQRPFPKRKIDRLHKFFSDSLLTLRQGDIKTQLP